MSRDYVTVTVTPSYVSDEEVELRKQRKIISQGMWLMLFGAVASWWAGVGLASLTSGIWADALVYAGRACCFWALIVLGHSTKLWELNRAAIDTLRNTEASASCKGGCKGCGSAEPKGKSPKQPEG